MIPVCPGHKVSLALPVLPAQPEHKDLPDQWDLQDPLAPPEQLEQLDPQDLLGQPDL